MAVHNEVTAADIARIAGVGRAAVSNWRRRHADFPAPTGGPPNSPTFAWPEVEAWLNLNGRHAAPLPATPSGAAENVAGCMTALLPDPGRGVVFDPACGDGTVLRSVADRFGPRARYVGQDTDEALVDAARAMLAAAGATDVVVDAVEDPTVALPGPVDVVVSITPANDRLGGRFTFEFGQPARADHALGWIQFCLSCLRPGGTAVVAAPFAVAVRASARRIRKELLRAGALVQVVSLPEHALGGTTGPWQLWTLHNPIGRPHYQIRMVDLGDREPERLPRTDADWAAVRADPRHSREVEAITLLDEEALLVPASFVAPEVIDVTAPYAALIDEYRTAVGRVPRNVPPLPPGDPTSLSALITVAELARVGALTFVDRHAVAPGDVVVGPGSGTFDATVVSDHVDDVEGTVVRCDPQLLDPHFLACFLRSEINRRQAAGTSGGTFRLDVKRARIPRLPLPEQQRYGRAFEKLMAFTAAADEAATTARETVHTAIYGLTSGIFAPDLSGE